MLARIWKRIRIFFKDSEVIFLARLQVLGGAIINVLSEADASSFAGMIPPQWFGIFLLVAGVVIELARRARDKELNGLEDL